MSTHNISIVLGLLLTVCVAACSDSHSDRPAPTPDTSVVQDSGQAVDTAQEQNDTQVEPEDTAQAEDSAMDTTEEADTDEPDIPEVQPEHQRELAASAEGDLLAGVGFGFLDGPVGISMAGYGGRLGANSPWNGQLKASQGFYGHMTIKAMVFEVEGERLAMIKIPTMSSEHAITDGIAEVLKTRHGLDMEGRILTGATHSHHAHARYWRLPESLAIVGGDSADEEMLDRLVTAFADAIQRAVDDLGPAEWGFGFEDDWDPQHEIYRDRRGVNDPLYPKDPRLTMLAVRRPEGTPMATIINFGMHGTVFGDGNDLLTEDSAGGLEMKFEEYFFAQEGQPILGMFIQSGGGDASPAGDALNHPDSARVERIGETAAPRVYDLYTRLEWKRETTLAVRSRRIDLRYNWMGYQEYPEFLGPGDEPYTWGGWQCNTLEATMEGMTKNCLSVELLLTSLGESLPNGEVHQTYLTVARLGDMFAVSLPGEPAYSVVKYLRDQIADRSTPEKPLNVLAFGYSQDHLLYLTHPDDWFLGGYESEMSLWGPLAGQYLVDRQLELVDDMLEGYNQPVFYEESPSLSVGAGSYEPRPFEVSIEPGTIREDPGSVAGYTRTDLVRFAFSGGDPSIGSPAIVVQAQNNDGTFTDVPSPSGWPGASYDNSRYHMITVYNPDPPMDRMILAERRHDWLVRWEIPEDFPAGTYRLRAVGSSWDGTQTQPWSLDSGMFTVNQSPTAELDVARDGDRLVLNLTLAPVAFTRAAEKSWPEKGWRLLDGEVTPDQRQKVQSPIFVQFLAADVPVGEPVLATYAAGGHTLDLGQVNLPQDAAIVLRVWLANDREPSSIEVSLP